MKRRTLMFAGALWLCVSGNAQSSDVSKLVSNGVVPLKSVVAGNGFEDMAPLLRVLDGVQIVGMGECTHGSREVFQMKHRMLEFLVEKMGYTVLAIEASMPDTVPMDLYVTKGQGTAEKAAAAQGFWTWSTEEVADMLRWMRKYNQDPKHLKKLRVVGFDMQNQDGAKTFLLNAAKAVGVKLDMKTWEGVAFLSLKDDRRKTIDEAIDRLVSNTEKKLGKERAELVKRVATVYEQAMTNSRREMVMQSAQQTLPNAQKTMADSIQLIKDLPDLDAAGKWGLEFLDRASKQYVEPTAEVWAKIDQASMSLNRYATSHPVHAKRIEAVCSLLNYFEFAHQNEDVMSVNYRDKCMAENTEWIVKTYFPGEKVMLWAYNGHIANHDQAPTYKWMGYYLSESLKEKYFPIGFVFNSGSFQAMGPMTGQRKLHTWNVPAAKKESVEAQLATLGQPVFYLDLGALSQEGRDWIDKIQPSRSIGALFDTQYAENFYAPIPFGKHFRGLIYIEKTTRARPVPTALKAYGAKKDW